MIPFVIALIMGILFIIYKTPPIRRDSLSYHQMGEQIAAEGLINVYDKSIGGVAPVYPVFLGICFKAFNGSNNAVRLIQVLLSAAVSLLVYVLARRYYGEKIGLIAGLLYSFCPTFAHYPGFFLRETLIVFLFFISYWMVLNALTNNSVSLSIVAVFSLIMILLSKPVFLFYGAFISLALYIYLKKNIGLWNRRSIIILLIVTLLPIIFSFGWIQRSKKMNPTVISSGQTGMVLLFNGSELALTGKERVARLVGLVSRNLAERLFPEIDYKTLWPYPAVAKKLLEDTEKNYAYLPDKQGRLLQMVYKLYKENPFGYIVNRLSTLMRLNAFQYPSRLNETDRWKDFYNRTDNKSLVVVLMDIILKTISNPFIWAVGGYIIMIKERMPIVPVLLPPLYINLIYCFLDGIPRYGLPALPFYLISGAVFFHYGFVKLFPKFYPFKKAISNTSL